MTSEQKFPPAKPSNLKEENQSKFLSNINLVLLGSINISDITKLPLKTLNMKLLELVSKSNSLKTV